MRLPNLRQQHCQWRDWLYCKILWSQISLWSLWIKGNTAWCCTVYSPLKLQSAIYGIPNDLDPADAQSYCTASPAWKINRSLTTGFWALCTIPEDLWFTVLWIWALQGRTIWKNRFCPAGEDEWWHSTRHITMCCRDPGDTGWLRQVGEVTLDSSLWMILRGLLTE